MKKISLKIALCAACLALSVSAAVLAGCKGGKPNVEGVTVSYSVSGATTTLNWQQVSGVTYAVYRKNSKLDDYKLLEANASSGSYTDEFRCGYYKVVLSDENGNKLKTIENIGEEADCFGENVHVIAPENGKTRVESVLTNIHSRQQNRLPTEGAAGEFTSDRYAVLMRPGVYDNGITLKQTYYTTYAGLGKTPEETSVRRLMCENSETGNALINFWRSSENYCVRGDVIWAVSQGASLRSMKIEGNLDLSQGGGYSSGGFLSNTEVTGKVSSGTQQQWLSRNTKWSEWEGEVWNMCFLGDTNAPSENYPAHRYTVKEATPVIREKPYLVWDVSSGYSIAVPKTETDKAGFTRATAENTDYITWENIYFARADKDSAATVNAAFEAGKSVVLTPGIYRLDQPIEIKKDNAVLLGLGIATLVPTGGNACLNVSGCNNVSVCGILLDAGTSPNGCLADIGGENSEESGIYLFDCHCRVGGATGENTYADTCIKVYAEGTVLDNVWLWRADHGNGVGWEKNNGDTGLHVYANNVICYGLFGEHFKKHNVVWDGNNGKIFFYQSEIAYDVPSQSVWMDGARNGYSSIQVGDGVTQFTAEGLGVYSNFHASGVKLDSAILTPEGAGITVRHIATVCLNGKGEITYPINERGTATSAAAQAVYFA